MIYIFLAKHHPILKRNNDLYLRDFTTYSAIGSVHEDIDVEIDGKKYVQNKIEAWKAHKTQFSDEWWGFNIPDEYKEEFLGVESYILAFNRGKFDSKSELI